MGLRLERLNSSPETIRRVVSVGLNTSENRIDIPIMPKAPSEARIGEISRMLLSEEQKLEDKDRAAVKKTSKKGFEPFVDPESIDDPLFINGYNGNFAQQMELNRKGVERVLKIAHLDGKVVLTQFIPSNKRTIEANSDGSVTAKRSLFLGQKVEEAEHDPLYRVLSIPQGWKIEINDKRITEKLMEKETNAKKRQKKFIGKFNGTLRKALFNAVGREKLSSVKDTFYRSKLSWSLLYVGVQSVLMSIFIPMGVSKYYATLLNLCLLFGSFGMTNALSRVAMKNNDKVVIPLPRKNIDSVLEFFMPFVEIDKVARVWTFLSLKGRKLAREAKSDAK